MKPYVVCVLAAVALFSAGVAAGEVKVDAEAGTVRLAVKVAEQGQYEVLKGSIEYLLVAKGGKAYETVFVTDCTPAELLEGLEKIGVKAGKPAAEGKLPEGTPLRVFVEYTAGDRKVHRAADEFILHKKTGKPLEPATWTFTGSRKTVDPETREQVLETSITRSLIGLHFSDASPLVQNSREEAKEENIYAVDLKSLPAAGTEVQMVLELARAKPVKDARRVHFFVSGRVQGVGFRAFTEGQARRLGLTGWVKNLADGRVEGVAEGPAEAVDKLLEQVKRGPRNARVDNLEVKDETPTGEFETFSVVYE